MSEGGKAAIQADDDVVAAGRLRELEGRIRDLERFNKLHAGEIIKLPGVRQIRTFFVLKEILSTTELPL